MEYIYKITNLKNGKFYIGKTKNVDKRWKEHISLAGKKRHPLYDAIQHHGVENFLVETIDQADTNFIDELERRWILQTNAISFGYNITAGGNGGDTFSNKPEELKEITRKKISKASKISNEKNLELNRKNGIRLWQSDDYVKKVKEAHKNATMNYEYKKRVSDGVKLALQSEQLRKKWSDVKKGSLNNRWLGYVIATDLNGNESKYETAKEASDKLRITAHLIREHCRNNTTFKRGLYKGWKFRFEIV